MTEQVTLGNDSWIGFETRLRGYVRRRVDPGSVDDVVGSILLRLVQHQDDLKAAHSPIAWALRVAANAVTDHHRRRASERRAMTQAEFEALGVPTAENPEENPASDDLALCLVPMLRALPAPYGDALMLTDIEGLTQAQAAARLGLSLSGMKSRVQRGRRKLKQALLRCCTVELDRRGGILDYHQRSSDRCSGC